MADVALSNIDTRDIGEFFAAVMLGREEPTQRAANRRVRRIRTPFPRGFPGNQGTTILRPSKGRDEYIAITHFDGEDTLEGWLRSTKRGEWLEKLRDIDICQEEVLSMAGMERWFTLPDQGANSMPPRYKTAALIFLGIYPLVLVLNALLGPVLAGLPQAVQVLVSLSISVPIMVWIVLPFLTRMFFGWLHKSPSRSAN